MINGRGARRWGAALLLAVTGSVGAAQGEPANRADLVLVDAFNRCVHLIETSDVAPFHESWSFLSVSRPADGQTPPVSSLKWASPGGKLVAGLGELSAGPYRKRLYCVVTPARLDGEALARAQQSLHDKLAALAATEAVVAGPALPDGASAEWRDFVRARQEVGETFAVICPRAKRALEVKLHGGGPDGDAGGFIVAERLDVPTDCAKEDI